MFSGVKEIIIQFQNQQSQEMKKSDHLSQLNVHTIKLAKD